MVEEKEGEKEKRGPAAFTRRSATISEATPGEGRRVVLAVEGERSRRGRRWLHVVGEMGKRIREGEGGEDPRAHRAALSYKREVRRPVDIGGFGCCWWCFGVVGVVWCGRPRGEREKREGRRCWFRKRGEMKVRLGFGGLVIVIDIG
ncbi:hypothetical protein HAX54_026143 [Datura stramonium]|uniref:Uncharacterized protein n=1 Tax=Datura stramonium TaxID=4076 RepID=A0ABS8V0U8_DATST|nr:hypothetical protein [Datura stramonium]